MTRRKGLKGPVPIILFFIILNGLFVAARPMLQRWGADLDVLLIGNAFLLVVSLLSYLLAKRGLTNTNPHAFVRGVYSGILLKLFVCMIAAFVYISIYKKDLNKPAFFTLMGLYLVYTFIEVSVLTKELKQQKNA
jgi:heme/copper-type cytochrome/quinol oxidase subunit 3